MDPNKLLEEHGNRELNGTGCVLSLHSVQATLVDTARR